MVLLTRRWAHWAILATTVASCRGPADRQPPATSLGPVQLLAADTGLNDVSDLASNAEVVPADPQTSASSARQGALLIAETGLYDVRDLTEDAAGRVWVLTGNDPFLNVFAPDGNSVVRFGRKGRGPMELSNPYALAPPAAGDSAVTVWDLGNRKLVKFGPSGQVLDASTWPMPRTVSGRGDIRQVTFGNPYHLGRIGERYVAAEYDQAVNFASDFINSRLLVIDPLKGPVDTIVDFTRPSPDQPRAALPHELVDIPLWTVCPDGVLTVFEPFGPTVRWYDSSGRLVAEDTLRLIRHELTDADVRRYMGRRAELELHDVKFDTAELRARVDEIVSHREDLFGAEAPIAVNLLCDPKGAAWFQRFSTIDDPLGFGRDWIVVARTGSTRYFSFPVGFVPWYLSENGAIGLVTDSVGLQHVGRVQIE